MRDPELILDDLNGWLENRLYNTVVKRSKCSDALAAQQFDAIADELRIIRNYLHEQIKVQPAEEYHWWNWLGDLAYDGILGLSKGVVGILEWHRTGVEKIRSTTTLRLVKSDRGANNSEVANFGAPKAK